MKCVYIQALFCIYKRIYNIYISCMQVCLLNHGRSQNVSCRRHRFRCLLHPTLENNTNAIISICVVHIIIQAIGHNYWDQHHKQACLISTATHANGLAKTIAPCWVFSLLDPGHKQLQCHFSTLQTNSYTPLRRKTSASRVLFSRMTREC